mmetsp:Transcript_2276/g.5775  ORF Transcript_2276/g.5775 Transcript_2276/m.5775 type:complete len:282 (+) Transcript_2276:171-1016(+)
MGQRARRAALLAWRCGALQRDQLGVSQARGVDGGPRRARQPGGPPRRPARSARLARSLRGRRGWLPRPRLLSQPERHQNCAAPARGPAREHPAARGPPGRPRRGCRRPLARQRGPGQVDLQECCLALSRLQLGLRRHGHALRHLPSADAGVLVHLAADWLRHDGLLQVLAPPGQAVQRGDRRCHRAGRRPGGEHSHRAALQQGGARDRAVRGGVGQPAGERPPCWPRRGRLHGRSQLLAQHLAVGRGRVRWLSRPRWRDHGWPAHLLCDVLGAGGPRLQPT